MVLNKGEVWKNRNIYPKVFKNRVGKKRSGSEHREAAWGGPSAETLTPPCLSRVCSAAHS